MKVQEGFESILEDVATITSDVGCDDCGDDCCDGDSDSCDYAGCDCDDCHGHSDTDCDVTR